MLRCTSLIASRLYVYVYNFNAKMHAKILILYFASFGCMNEWINEWQSEWYGCVLWLGGAAEGLAVARSVLYAYASYTRQRRDGKKTNPKTQGTAHLLHTESPVPRYWIEVHWVVRVKGWCGGLDTTQDVQTGRRRWNVFFLSFHSGDHISSTYSAIPFELNRLF